MAGYDYDLGIVGGGAAGLTRSGLTSRDGPVNRPGRQGEPFDPSRGPVVLRQING